MNYEPLIDCDPAAELLGIHPKTLREKAKAGEIPAMRIGTRWKFRASVLDLWITNQLQCDRRPCSAPEAE